MVTQEKEWKEVKTRCDQHNVPVTMLVYIGDPSRTEFNRIPVNRSVDYNGCRHYAGAGRCVAKPTSEYCSMRHKDLRKR